MKKYLPLLALVLINPAYANDRDLKLETIKEMYQLSQDGEIGSRELFPRYASTSYIQALDLESVVEDSGEMCGTGGDDMWSSSDVDFSQPLSFSIDKNEFVKVKIGNSAEVSYELSCNEYSCQIEDLYDTYGSHKRLLQNSCS